MDSGKFNWLESSRFPGLTEPDPSYHGICYAKDVGKRPMDKVRTQLLRDTGAALSPFNAFLLLQGLETLSCGWNGTWPRPGRSRVPGRTPGSGMGQLSRLDKQQVLSPGSEIHSQGTGAVFTFGVKAGRRPARGLSTVLNSFRCWPMWGMPNRWPSTRRAQPIPN